MIGLRCILFIFLFVYFFQGSLAIEVSFSAEDGGESVGISDEYDVSADVSVSEESEAKFGNVEMTNSREVAGSGDAKAVQSYSGSGYTGHASFMASGALSSLTGFAQLTPYYLNAAQNIVVSGDWAKSFLGVMQGNSEAFTTGSVNDGSMIVSQVAWTGSVHVSESVQAQGNNIVVTTEARQGAEEWSKIETGIESAPGYPGSFSGILTTEAGHSTHVTQSGSLNGAYNVQGANSEMSKKIAGIASLNRNFESGTGIEGAYLVGFTGVIQDIIDAAAPQTAVLLPAGYYDEDVDFWKNLRIHVENNGKTTVNILALTNNARLLADSSGLFAPQVYVNPGSRINDGLSLASSSGTVNVAAGNYNENVEINKDLTLKGTGDPNANSFTLNGILGTDSGGITAPIINVNPTARIQDGVTLASSGGTVNVAAGIYLEDVNINKVLTLKGTGNPTATSFTLNAILETGSCGITAPLITVNSGSKIQDGITLASTNGKVNVNAGTYGDNLDQSFYSKGITLTGFNNPVTNSFTLNQDVAGKISGITANTVTVNPYAKILQGIDLANEGAMVNVNGAAGYTYSDDLTQSFYASGITLTGINNPVTNSISLNQIVDGKIGGITANTVNVQNSNAKIQDGVNLVSSGGTVNIAADTYNENLIINKLLTLLGAGSGDDTSFNTLINAADRSKSVISIVTGGTSEDNRLIVKDLQAAGATSSSGISINGVGDISHITLDNIKSSGNYNGAEFSALGSGNSISDVIISNSQLTNSGMEGVNIDARNHGSIVNVEIKDSTISDSGGNGVRVNAGVRYSSDSRVSGTIGSIEIKGCTISNSGGSGVDVRAYSGSTISSVGIAGSIISGAVQGVYGDAYYGGSTIGNIGITGSTISDALIGVSMGATGGGINNNIALTDSTISNSLCDGIWAAAAYGGKTGLVITRSTITGSGWNGVSTKTWAGGSMSKLEAHESNIYGNNEFGIMNQAGTVFDATNNWWGNGGTGVNAGKPGEEGNNRAGSVLYTPTEAWRRSYGQTTAQTLGIVTYTPWSTLKFLEAS